MNKKYLMRGFAALALIAGFSSCVKDVDGMSAEEEAAKGKENAELQLGITIPDDQNWDMASQVNAEVTVNGDYGVNYIVNIYENNPFINDTAVLLGRASVVSGGTVDFDFTCPNGLTTVFAAIKDEKGYTYVKPVTVENGKVEAVFGNTSAGSRAMRTATNSSVNIPTGTPRATIEAQAAAILAKSVELNSTNNEVDNPTLNYYYPNMNINPNYVINYLISGTWNGLVNKLGAAGRELTGGWTEEWGNKVPAYKIVPRTVYVEGKWTIPTGQYQACGNGYTGENVVDGIIIVGTDGELEVNGTLNMANLARLIVLPGGRVTGTGAINICNGSTSGEESYNFGTISVKQLNENFGNFFNYGTITSETLVGGAGTSCFVNYGKIKVTTAYGNSGAPANLQIKNNCWFEASGEVAAKVIENAANAYLTCASMKTSCGYGNDNVDSYIAVDNNSLLHVDGMWRNNNTTVIGPSSGDNAFIEIGTIKQWDFTDGQTGMIQNNIYFSYESIERSDNNSDTEWCVNYNVNKGGNNGVTFIKAKAANVAPIAESDCAPGYTPVPPAPIIEEPKIYTYAFEDQLFAGDYDMNDVVLKVSYHANRNAKGVITSVDSTKLDVKMVAAGATFKIKVLIGGTATSQTAPDGSVMRTVDLEGAEYLFDGKEIHEAFGVNAGVMVNTGNGKAQDGVAPVLDTVSVPSDWDGDFTHLRFSIEVLSTGHTLTYPNDDVYPYALMIPTDWAWPLERISIVQAYWYHNGTDITESFAWWAQTSPHPASAELWYNHPVTGKVMTNE